jgi:hypothetical protein
MGLDNRLLAGARSNNRALGALHEKWISAAIEFLSNKKTPRFSDLRVRLDFGSTRHTTPTACP